MSGVFQILLEALPAGVISTSCFAIAAFLGRNNIKHWLNRDLEQLRANFQKELESIKAGHQRELEAYKISLIAEAEKTKAEQGVRSAVALKFSEQQFTAVNEVSNAYADLGQKAISLYQKYSNLDHQITQVGLSFDVAKEMIEISEEEFNRCSQELTAAIFSVKLFMEEGDVDLLHNYDALLTGVVQSGLCNFMGDQGLEVDKSTYETCLVKEFGSLASIREKINYVRSKETEVSKTLRKYADRFISMQRGG